jgi:cell fate (sporulation/competence/biofilm development) regulator YmcA (YheA/YmcA/DUF963 family)
MQHLNEQPKQQRAELAALLGAKARVNGFTQFAIHHNLHLDGVIQALKQRQKAAMNAKLFATF